MEEMRRTLGQTKEALEFMIKIDKLTSDQRSHMRMIIERLIDCCLNNEQHGMVVLASDDDPHAEVFTVNCSEMDAALALYKLQEVFTAMNMVDAPEQGMMN
jgi:hypothetical protein